MTDPDPTYFAPQHKMIHLGRPLEEVRAAALTQAVNLRRHDHNVSAIETLQIAKLFEEYLAGSDAS